MIKKILEVSTGNVTIETMQAVEKSNLALTTMAGPYGAFVAVLDDTALLEKLVAQSDLKALLNEARSQDCEWLYLDQDAEPLENFPYYEW